LKEKLSDVVKLFFWRILDAPKQSQLTIRQSVEQKNKKTFLFKKKLLIEFNTSIKSMHCLLIPHWPLYSSFIERYFLLKCLKDKD